MLRLNKLLDSTTENVAVSMKLEMFPPRHQEDGKKLLCNLMQVNNQNDRNVYWTTTIQKLGIKKQRLDQNVWYTSGVSKSVGMYTKLTMRIANKKPVHFSNAN